MTAYATSCYLPTNSKHCITSHAFIPFDRMATFFSNPICHSMMISIFVDYPIEIECGKCIRKPRNTFLVQRRSLRDRFAHISSNAQRPIFPSLHNSNLVPGAYGVTGIITGFVMCAVKRHGNEMIWEIDKIFF